ncbi:MAG: hypothetical protein ACI3XT_04075 [Butyricicoccaceae bacterium]
MSRKFKHDGGSKASRKKSLVLMASILLILAISVGGTLAYLVTNAGPVPNTFQPTKVEPVVQEKFENHALKSDVSVKNDGTTAAYIRVMLVPTWLDAETNQPVAVSASLNDLNITWSNSEKWVRNAADGYYYYTEEVAPGESTDVLIDEAAVATANGCKMELQIFAQAIQSVPDKAVEGAWSNNKVTVDANNGSLSIRNN